MTDRSGTMVFFDVDGCLVDSTEPIRRSLDAALTGVGLGPLVDGELARHIGPPLQQTLAELLVERAADPGLLGQLIDGYRAHYAPLSVEVARSYDGVADALATCASIWRLGVVTSKPVVFAEPILAALGFGVHFEIVAGPGLEVPEPKAETMERAVGMLRRDVVAARCVMVGDRHHDIAAARAHGMHAIGVTWGYGRRGELDTADAVIEHPTDLPAAIEGVLADEAR
ncbi:MAG: HAD hydrolase-like protein [Actinomycetota bacterium]|nr:HAD hydrolase-like protein [Actinomycetota bacterium]